MKCSHSVAFSLKTLPTNFKCFFFRYSNIFWTCWTVISSEVIDAINSLIKSNSLDCFELYADMVKCISEWLVDPVVPRIPILKIRYSELAEIYRPIAMIRKLEFFLKFYTTRILQYVENSNLLNSHQFGFGKQRSTINAVRLIVTKIIQSGVDQACGRI